MGLSRLENFLKSTRGNILYVNPNDLDATDSIENQGNSLTRPFKTIQRALVESSRFSYQKGLDNDRFAKTTILLYPGDHVIDNRPGWIPDGSNNFRLRNGTTSDDFPPFDLTTNFDLENPNNELYKLNSIYGGVIVPRGTSLVGFDLRKTKLRPKYVPSPTNDATPIGDAILAALNTVAGFNNPGILTPANVSIPFLSNGFFILLDTSVTPFTKVGANAASTSKPNLSPVLLKS